MPIWLHAEECKRNFNQSPNHLHHQPLGEQLHLHCIISTCIRFPVKYATALLDSWFLWPTCQGASAKPTLFLQQIITSSLQCIFLPRRVCQTVGADNSWKYVRSFPYMYIFWTVYSMNCRANGPGVEWVYRPTPIYSEQMRQGRSLDKQISAMTVMAVLISLALRYLKTEPTIGNKWRLLTPVEKLFVAKRILFR